jgi:hypothetical protein
VQASRSGEQLHRVHSGGRLTEEEAEEGEEQHEAPERVPPRESGRPEPGGGAAAGAEGAGRSAVWAPPAGALRVSRRGRGRLPPTSRGGKSLMDFFLFKTLLLSLSLPLHFHTIKFNFYRLT